MIPRLGWRDGALAHCPAVDVYVLLMDQLDRASRANSTSSLPFGAYSHLPSGHLVARGNLEPLKTLVRRFPQRMADAASA